MLHTNTRRRLEECYALLRKQMRTATRTASNHGDSQWEDAMREGGRIRPRPAWQRKLREIHLLLSLCYTGVLFLLPPSQYPNRSPAIYSRAAHPPFLPPLSIRAMLARPSLSSHLRRLRRFCARDIGQHRHEFNTRRQRSQGTE